MRGLRGEDSGARGQQGGRPARGRGDVLAGPLWQMEGKRLSQEQPFDWGGEQGDRCPGPSVSPMPHHGTHGGFQVSNCYSVSLPSTHEHVPKPFPRPPPATRSPHELRPEVAPPAAEEARPCSRVPLSTSAGSGVPEPKAWRVGCFRSL